MWSQSIIVEVAVYEVIFPAIMPFFRRSVAWRMVSCARTVVGVPVQYPRSLIVPVLELCRRAGDLIRHHYERPGASEYSAKGDDSPLTQADLDSHALLEAGLCELCPELPVLSEESAAIDPQERRRWGSYWLVDPLDGTKEFLARTGEFTVNIALIDAHRPVFGALYAPMELTAWVGIPGEHSGRYRLRENGDWSEEATAVRRLESGAPLTVLASRRHRGTRLQRCLDWLDENWGPLERRNSGSAIKFCQLADGRGDFYPRFSPCCEWDTAAGQAVLEAAGGALLGMDGNPLRYNTGDSLMSPNFYAIADPRHPLWQGLPPAQESSSN